MDSKDVFVCQTCHIGHVNLRLTTYIQQYGETLISVPNTPAWICDVCHEQQFDASSIQRIELLVGQAGPPPNRYRPKDKESSQAKQRADSKNNSRKMSPPSEVQGKDKPRSKAKG
jgi:YgiT-type zinc finger domain-containing protein